jgi:hypothetical protein
MAAAGPDHLGPGPAGAPLPYRAGRAVDDDRLLLGQLSVVEQALPRCRVGLRHRGGVDVVDGLRLEG